MMFYRVVTLLVLFSLVVFAAGCNCFSNRTTPSNPFAQNLQTVPPPSTFSSQDSYLGQTPGTYVPQTPASTYSSDPSMPVSSAPPTTFSPSDVLFSDATNGGEKAMLFRAAEHESGWTAVEVASTGQTAFQVMEAKSQSTSPFGSLPDAAESLVVGVSHIVTTITDESQPAAALPEPQLLYRGVYAE